MSEDMEERVRQRAHQLWEQAGRPEGLAEEHWEQALQQITAEDADGDQPGGCRVQPVHGGGGADGGDRDSARSPVTRGRQQWQDGQSAAQGRDLIRGLGWACGVKEMTLKLAC